MMLQTVALGQPPVCSAKTAVGISDVSRGDSYRVHDDDAALGSAGSLGPNGTPKCSNG
jgi:hypothetical protein